MRFKKKPVVVDAVQWWQMGDHPAVTMFSHSDGYYPVIRTLEGPMHVTPGDWIITGVKGECYPCKPDIFAATYEEVEA
jgi:hypothetical protein